MIDELTLYNLEVKYHNLKDIANAIEEIARAEVIEDLLKQVKKEEMWLFKVIGSNQNINIAFGGIYAKAERLKGIKMYDKAREFLISEICPAYMKDNCENYQCSECKEKLNEIIDKYEKMKEVH